MAIAVRAGRGTVSYSAQAQTSTCTCARGLTQKEQKQQPVVSGSYPQQSFVLLVTTAGNSIPQPPVGVMADPPDAAVPPTDPTDTGTPDPPVFTTEQQEWLDRFLASRLAPPVTATTTPPTVTPTPTGA